MRRSKITGAVLAAIMTFTLCSPPAYCPDTGFSVTAYAASKLAAPKNAKAKVTDNKIALSWSKVKGADAYRVFICKPGTSKYKTLKTTAKTSVSVNTSEPGTYKFRVAALVRKNGKYTVQTLSSAFSAKIPAKETNTKEETMTDYITVNTQSSIRIDAGDLIIRIDPYKISGEPHDADIVLVTHAHYDHFSSADIRKVSKSETVFAAPASMKKELSDIGISNAVLLSPDEETELLGIKVETVKAYNVNKSFHPLSQHWLGYIVTVNGKRIYAAGDTDATQDAKNVKCDIALVPIGGTYTMNAKEAAALINAIAPEVAIPIHYGSIVGSASDGEKFKELVNKDIKVELKL